MNLEELKDHPLPLGNFIGGVLVASCLVTYLLNRMCYEKILFFQRLNSLRILSRFLIENNLYLIKNIRRENKTIEKIILPQVYLKQSRYKIEVRIILEGNIPSPIRPPEGCKFHPRCYMACEKCKRVPPPYVEVEPGHFVACHFLDKKIDENGKYLFERNGKKEEQ